MRGGRSGTGAHWCPTVPRGSDAPGAGTGVAGVRFHVELRFHVEPRTSARVGDAEAKTGTYGLTRMVSVFRVVARPAGTRRILRAAAHSWWWRGTSSAVTRAGVGDTRARERQAMHTVRAASGGRGAVIHVKHGARAPGAGTHHHRWARASDIGLTARRHPTPRSRVCRRMRCRPDRSWRWFPSIPPLLPLARPRLPRSEPSCGRTCSRSTPRPRRARSCTRRRPGAGPARSARLRRVVAPRSGRYAGVGPRSTRRTGPAGRRPQGASHGRVG